MTSTPLLVSVRQTTLDAPGRGRRWPDQSPRRTSGTRQIRLSLVIAMLGDNSKYWMTPRPSQDFTQEDEV